MSFFLAFKFYILGPIKGCWLTPWGWAAFSFFPVVVGFGCFLTCDQREEAVCLSTEFAGQNGSHGSLWYWAAAGQLL